MFNFHTNIFLIRIEPDWNVKLAKFIKSTDMYGIRIEPDWNVKSKDDIVEANRMRLE